MNFTDYLKKAALEIDGVLEEVFKELRSDAKRLSPNLLPLIDVSIDACEGGKHLRGALVLIGYNLMGKKTNQEILKIAASMEILQTALLCHDDIFDRSEVRRGKPSIYMAFGGDHYGISQAICVGDVGFFLTQDLISRAEFEPKNLVSALHSFNRSILRTCLGQMLDLQVPKLIKEPTEEEAILIYHLKTAYYTLIAPLQLGAALGGAGTELLDTIDSFGRDLGIAFQIHDDILGVFGEEEKMGKSASSDIEEGKNTLLLVHAHKNANPTQKSTLKKLYGQGKTSKDETEKIRQIFKDTGALDYSKKKAIEYADRSKMMIPKLTSDRAYQILLEQMASFLVDRSK